MNTNKKFFIAKIMADTNSYILKLNDEPFHYGHEVIIKTEQGTFLAHITSFPFEETNTQNEKAIFLRYATTEDKAAEGDMDRKSIEIKREVSTLSKELSLGMNITHVLCSLDNYSITICYTAKGRVDFRKLLKVLKNRRNEKIIMKQIGKKDRMNSFHIDQRLPINTYYR